MKLLKKDSNNSEFSVEVVNVNSAAIKEIPDPIPLSGKEKGTLKLDFPLKL